jgi:hypothetical protein
MTTNHASTGGTTPFLFFSQEECFYAILFDRCEIFKKAHPEKFRISHINMFEVLTGILCTLVTKLYRMGLKMFA